MQRQLEIWLIHHRCGFSLNEDCQSSLYDDENCQTTSNNKSWSGNIDHFVTPPELLIWYPKINFIAIYL